MKYLFFVFCFLCQLTLFAQEPEENEVFCDTCYPLLSSIKESCTNIIFSDSMYRAWNIASINSIITTSAKNINYDLGRSIVRQFQKGENSRLCFGKYLNDDSLITKADFDKGFFIIEKVRIGLSSNHDNYLIVDRGNEFMIYSQRINWIEVIWEFKRETIISKRKFYKLYNKLIKQNTTEELPIGQFIVTKFTNTKIESFVFYNYVERKWIEKFENLFTL